MECAEEATLANPLTGEPDVKAEAGADLSEPEVCRFFLMGRCHFGERCRLSHGTCGKPVQAEETECSKTRRTRKKSGKAEKTGDGDRKELQEPEKKPRMRTADDVISRILWDSSVDPSNFVVGHLDRFLGVLERPFSDFSWDTQVCDCDYSEELTIPRHRIQYFSYKGQRVWDRDTRTDRVFGSTGQTVLPPFDREDDAQENAIPVARQDMEEMHELDNSVDHVSDPKDATNCGSNGPKDKDSEDARLAREAGGLSVSQRDGPISLEEEWKDSWEKEDKEDEEAQPMPTISQEPRPNRPSRKPTHFICFRVDSPAALLAFQRLQRKILTHLPQSEEFWVSPATLHVTLSLLVLQSPAEVQAAVELLRSIVRNIYKPPISVVFLPKLKHFNGKVLFLPPRPLPDIQSLNTPLQEAFKEKGWLHRHSKCPNYHLTLAKVEGEVMERMFEDVGAIKLTKDINFGKLEVDKLYLCVNGQPKTDSGFYQIICAVQFPTV